MANKFIKGLVEKLTMLSDDWFVIQPDAEESIAYKIKKSNVKSDRTEPNTWYVNTNGNDANVGSDKFPFETIQAAHDAASEGDILCIQNRDYLSTSNVTITKSLTLKGPIPANDNDIAVPAILGIWSISAGKDLMVINMWIATSFTHPSVSWFLQCTGCHLAFDSLPARKTKLIANDCLWELGNGHDLFSLVMDNTKTRATKTINIGSEFIIKGSQFQGTIIAGIDSSSLCELKNGSIEGAATVTGDLLKVNAVVVGAETVSGTPTSRQAKVFDDSVEFKDKVSIGVSSFLNLLDVAGGMAVGSGIAGIQTAPADGLLVEGESGFGVTNPLAQVHIHTDAGTLFPSIFSGTSMILSATQVGGSSVAVSLISGITGTSEINFGDTSDENVGNIKYRHSENRLSFRTLGISDRVTIDAAGNLIVGDGIISGSAKGDFNQTSATGARPPLKATQADLSEEMIKFDATIGVGNPIEAKAAKTLTGTHFVRANIEGVGNVYVEVGTIA